MRFRFIPAMQLLRQMLGGWQFSETAFLHSGVPFSVLSHRIRPTTTASFKGAGRSMRTGSRAFRSIARRRSPA